MTRFLACLIAFGVLCMVASHLSGCARDGTGSYSISPRAPASPVACKRAPDGTIICKTI